jgi:hypothetical protein
VLATQDVADSRSYLKILVLMAQDSETGLLITTIDVLEAQTAMTGHTKPVVHVLLAQYLEMREL